MMNEAICPANGAPSVVRIVWRGPLTVAPGDIGDALGDDARAAAIEDGDSGRVCSGNGVGVRRADVEAARVILRHRARRGASIAPNDNGRVFVGAAAGILVAESGDDSRERNAFGRLHGRAGGQQRSIDYTRHRASRDRSSAPIGVGDVDGEDPFFGIRMDARDVELPGDQSVRGHDADRDLAVSPSDGGRKVIGCAERVRVDKRRDEAAEG